MWQQPIQLVISVHFDWLFLYSSFTVNLTLSPSVCWFLCQWIWLSVHLNQFLSLYLLNVVLSVLLFLCLQSLSLFLSMNETLCPSPIVLWFIISVVDLYFKFFILDVPRLLILLCPCSVTSIILWWLNQKRHFHSRHFWMFLSRTSGEQLLYCQL